MNKQPVVSKISWGEEPDFFGPHYRFRQDLIIGEILKHYRYGKVLDAGSGSGWLSLRLAQRGFDVVGIDNAPGFINYASSKAKQLGVFKKAKFKLEDVRSLGFHDGSFDVIICTEVLEHLKDDKETVIQLKRVLKKGGICIVTVPAYMKYWGVEDEYGGHLRRYTRQALGKLFSDWIVEKNDYFGFPVGSLYYHLLYRPMFSKKIISQKNKNNQGVLFLPILGQIKKIFANQTFSLISSLPFLVDRLFIGSERGFALILVAKKK